MILLNVNNVLIIIIINSCALMVIKFLFFAVSNKFKHQLGLLLHKCHHLMLEHCKLLLSLSLKFFFFLSFLALFLLNLNFWLHMLAQPLKNIPHLTALWSFLSLSFPNCSANLFLVAQKHSITRSRISVSFAFSIPLCLLF